ncbi:MAG: heme o synthase [Acidobacteriota bacterium]|nr:heme o synthase [Acidobacteriota bacterium]
MKDNTVALTAERTRLVDFFALTKPRLNSLTVATTGVGYFLGATSPIDLLMMLHVLIGSGLVAGGAAAFNQVAERDIDETMARTKLRPMPTGRVSPNGGRIFAAIIATAGLAILVVGTNVVAATVAATTLFSYVLIYTPLKRRTSWATIIGAVPGALPPVIGWTAARGALTVEAWVLFSIVFLWQLPHFHALSWLYRSDFKKSGLPLIAVQDPDGRRTAKHALFFGCALVPVSLAPALVGLAGFPYLVVATVLGAAFLVLGVRFLSERSEPRARALFLGSLVYLSLLWVALVSARLL